MWHAPLYIPQKFFKTIESILNSFLGTPQIHSHTPLWFNTHLPELLSIPDPAVWIRHGILYLHQVMSTTGLKIFQTLKDEYSLPDCLLFRYLQRTREKGRWGESKSPAPNHTKSHSPVDATVHRISPAWGVSAAHIADLKEPLYELPNPAGVKARRQAAASDGTGSVCPHCAGARFRATAQDIPGIRETGRVGEGEGCVYRSGMIYR